MIEINGRAWVEDDDGSIIPVEPEKDMRIPGWLIPLLAFLALLVAAFLLLLGVMP